MKVKLYKPFEHWYHGGTIYLYSDPHFADPESKKENPNWPDADEIVKSINSCLGKNDTIIFLGDIGEESYVKKIKGYKVLLLGNHDKGASNYIKKYYSYLKDDPNNVLFESLDSHECEAFNFEYFMDFNVMPTISNNHMFDEVYEGPLFINEKICLSHEPIYLEFGYNIHGHRHFGIYTASTVDTNARINIASDVVNFKPLRLDKLISEFKVMDIHRITIDRATERKYGS